ncbi:Ig-like domain-containing protein, partial [bacterium]|nr:Ig-like domain-containing protein [bacterium]
VSDTTTFTITPSGTTITPGAISTTLEENWQDIEAKEGQLVTFTGVVSYIDKTSNRNKLGVQDATETDSYGITVFWYDGTGDITWDAVADFTLGETVTVVGIVGQMDYDSPFTSYYQILVRKQSDVEKVTNLKIAGNAYSHAISWGQDDPVAGLSMSLFKNNEYKELLDSANRVMTVVTDGSGYFEFQGGLEEGVTYIVFPEAEDDDLSPAVAHWIDGVITGSYYPLISDLSADVTDVVVDMVDYVDIVTPDDTVFDGPVTLEWNLYTGNGLTDNWVGGTPPNITYVITIYELDGSGDMKPAPYVYKGLGVDATSYNNSLPTGDYKYYVFADAYNYGGANTIPFAMTDIAHPFSVDFTPPELLTITVVDNHTLDVDFSEEVTLATAQTLANYVVTVGDINPTVASRTDTDTVRLTFASDFAQDLYTLTIEGVEDVDGNAIELSNENEGEFTITVGSPPELTAVDVVNTATLTVTFSEEVTLASSQTLGNYVVTAGDISPASATRITTNTVTLVFAAPFAQGLYLLTVEGVEDTEANAVELSGNNALNFSISVGTPPELTNTVVTDNSTLTLTFSEEVTQVTAETEANFVVTPGNITPATATRTSVTTVQLDFASLFAPDNYVITVEGVEDTDGNGVEFSGVNTGAFAIVAVNPPGIASIDVVSNTVLDVTFTEEITQATGELEGNYLVTPGDLVPSTAIRTSATVVR